MPVFQELYRRVIRGDETRRVLTSCGKANYQQQLAKELQSMANSEMWLAGKATRSLRPAEGGGTKTRASRGVAGRLTY
jgi:ketol-acid reductoisomerase